ncbi:hydroxylamine reductase [Clostridium sp.]|uniref:hydroxylamine reductase n=1 Tax=Clostridium sp. TaxID=1506 RepID=UPI002FC6FDC7
MENKMFCYQCQETANCSGCTISGACGKTPTLAKLQDMLIYVTKGLSEVINENRKHGYKIDSYINHHIILNLFSTITNANFDNNIFYERILKTINIKNQLIKNIDINVLSKYAKVNFTTNEEIDNSLESAIILNEKDEDIRSMKELITYGLKGLSAYMKHAIELNHDSEEIHIFIQSTLGNILSDSLSLNDLITLSLECGKVGVDGMALLDNANTSTYGSPEITKVNIGTRNNPGILVSGHDLLDLEILLKQTIDSGVDVYTHSEMLPAHYYPEFKKYPHFVGNYGGAWYSQVKDFETFNGPIIMTTNCIVPPRASYKSRLFTTGAAGYTGCTHIDKDSSGNKDFSSIIALAKTLPAPIEIESGEIIGGFAHNQVLSLADKVVDAVKTGAIKKFVVMAGCDGRQVSREYYTDFAKSLPNDSVILTAGCAKYRYNKLNLGDINGIPRVLDAGQCNDSYSLAVIALKLQEVFELDDINSLPIVYNIAWYEQKAVIVLLSLLHLGIKNIHLGPTLPGFLSPNVVNFLVENFNIAGISTVENDLNKFFS